MTELSGCQIARGLATHAVQLFGLPLELLHLGQGEDVGGAVVPVVDLGAVVAHGVRVDEAGLLDRAFPVGARGQFDAAHQLPWLPSEPEPPKPPRETLAPSPEIPRAAVLPAGSVSVPPVACCPTAGTVRLFEPSA